MSRDLIEARRESLTGYENVRNVQRRSCNYPITITVHWFHLDTRQKDHVDPIVDELDQTKLTVCHDLSLRVLKELETILLLENSIKSCSIASWIVHHCISAKIYFLHFVNFQKFPSDNSPYLNIFKYFLAFLFNFPILEFFDWISLWIFATKNVSQSTSYNDIFVSKILVIITRSII